MAYDGILMETIGIFRDGFYWASFFNQGCFSTLIA